MSERPQLGQEDSIGLTVYWNNADFKRGSREYVNELDKLNKRTDSMAAQMSTDFDEVFKNTVRNTGSVTEGYAAMGQAMADAGMSYSKIVEAIGATNAAHMKLKVNIKETRDEQESLDEEVSSGSSYLDKYLQRLALWITVGALVRGIVTKLQQTLSENIKRLHENSVEMERLNKESDKLGLAVTEAIFPTRQFSGLMDVLATAAKGGAEALALFVSAWSGLESAYHGLIWRGMTLKEAIDFGGEAAKDRLLGFTDAMNMAGESTEDFAKAQEDLAKILADNDDELSRHADKLKEIEQKYKDAISEIIQAGAKKQSDIVHDLMDDIAKIREDAADDVAKLVEKNNKRIAELHDQAREDDKNAEARHQAEMEFARRRFQLTQIQNERQYQARRRRLVGEGDVLAIEELDEQYQLQRQAQEENFALQQEQAEAMYRLQAKIQEESMRRQVAMLRQSLAEQIAEIQQNRDEKIADAQAAAVDEALQNKRAMEDEALAAREARNQALDDEKKYHQERTEAIAQELNNFAKKYDMQYSELDRIVEAHWGPGSPMDIAVSEAFRRWQAYAAMAASYMGQTMASASTAIGRATMPPGYRSPSQVAAERARYGGQSVGGGALPGLQYGGEVVATKPTLVSVAEGRPERITAEPMYPGNLSMSLSWRGGPIQVQGNGSLSGADLSAFGSQLTVAIMSRMEESVGRQFSTRGR